MFHRSIHPTGPEGFAMAHSEMAEEEAAMRASTLANQASALIPAAAAHKKCNKPLTFSHRPFAPSTWAP